MLKIAQIGYGHLGKWHAQKAHKVYGESFVAIVEVDEQRHEEINTAYPDLLVTSDLDEVIPEVDAVIIVTPTSFHFPILEKCINNNLHVFCEKPLTETYEQSIKIKNTLELKSHLKLQAGHSERFHPCWPKLMPSLSRSSMLKLTRRAPYKGRGADVDIVQDLMIHDFDLIYYFLGETPVSIKACGRKLISGNYDYVSAYLTFENNRTAYVTASRVSTDEQREVIAVTETGELRVDLLNNVIEESSCLGGDFVVQQSDYVKADHLLIEHEHFSSSINNGEGTIVNIDDATIVMKMIDLTVRSLISGETIFWE